MAYNALIVLAIVLTSLLNAHAGDPDITTDYLVSGDASKFVFRGLRESLMGPSPKNESFTLNKATQAEFPALAGQSVAYATLRYSPNGINGPHTHPRSAELILVLQGWLEVGFVDSNNKLVSKVLKTGDVFVFPKGLVHFEVNRDQNHHALAIAAFGSSDPGAVVLQKALFESGIGDDVLAKSFKTDIETIKKL